MVSMTDLHWAAGFLDGEGSFCVSSRKKSHQVSVQATQRTRPSLEKLQRLFGGNIYTVPHKGFTGGTMYLWMLYGGAAGVMMTLYSIMSPFRQGQIMKALTLWKSVPTNHKGVLHGVRR